MGSVKLQAAEVQSLPSCCYYIADFINIKEEKAILAAIYDTPLKHWTILTHRRLLSLPSQLTGSKRDTLLDASMPAFLVDPVVEHLKDLGIFQHSPHQEPNHCLVNEYLPGQGIMPHEDGPAYHPITATISLSSHAVLNIYKKNGMGEREQAPTWRILQEPRSLLVTSADMYMETLHGIDEVEMDTDLGPTAIVNWKLLGDPTAFTAGCATREKRVSLTYRDVLKVSKLGNALKFMTKR